MLSNKKNKKRLILLNLLIAFALTLSLSANVVYAEELYENEEEYSQAYKHWLSLSEKEKQLFPEPDKYLKEFVPTTNFSNEFQRISLYSGAFSSIEGAVPESSQLLPSKYDLRDVNGQNFVSPVKTQLGGTCWAYSAASVLETSLMLNGVGSYEFNPVHTSHAIYPRFSDAVNPYGLKDYELGAGSFYENALDYWASGMGPISVSSGFKGNSRQVLSAKETLINTENIKVNASYTLPTINVKTASSDIIQQYIELVKNEIMTNGALEFYSAAPRNMKNKITANGYKCGETFNSDTNAVYTTNYEDYGCSPHAMVIIGWDDSFSKEKFNSAPETGEKPSRDGAWIVKNSWGANHGDEGYYYYSYEDFNLNFLGLKVISDSSDDKDYNNIYQYAPQVKLGDRTNSKYENSAINVFDKTKNIELLESVSFYLYDANNTNVQDIGYEIYVNSTDGGTEDSKFKLVQSADNQFIYNGYYTVDLQNPIELTGEKFAVKIKLKNARTQIVATSKINSSKNSYIKTTSGTFEEVGAVRMKAFTTVTGEEESASTVIYFTKNDSGEIDSKQTLDVRTITSNIDNASTFEFKIKNNDGQYITEQFDITPGVVISNMAYSIIQFPSILSNGIYTVETYYNNNKIDEDIFEYSGFLLVSDVIGESFYEGELKELSLDVYKWEDIDIVKVVNEQGIDKTELFDISYSYISGEKSKITIKNKINTPYGNYNIVMENSNDGIKRERTFSIKNASIVYPGEITSTPTIVYEGDSIFDDKINIFYLTAEVGNNLTKDDISYSIHSAESGESVDDLFAEVTASEIDEERKIKFQIGIKADETENRTPSGDYEFYITDKLTTNKVPFTVHKRFDIENKEELPEHIYKDNEGFFGLSVSVLDVLLSNVTVDELVASLNCIDDGSLYNFSKINIEDVGDNQKTLHLTLPTNLTVGTYRVSISDKYNILKRTFDFDVLPIIYAETIEILNEDLTVNVDETLTIETKILPDDTTDKRLDWRNSNPDIVTIDENGNVKGIKRGTANITVYSYDMNASKTFNVKVKEPKLTASQTIITSSYDDKLYRGYGGEVTNIITAQDLDDNINLQVTITDNANQNVTNNFEITGATIKQGNASIKIGVDTDVSAGMYQVKVVHKSLSTTFEFEVFEAEDLILLSEITSSPAIVYEQIPGNFTLDAVIGAGYTKDDISYSVRVASSSEDYTGHFTVTATELETENEKINFQIGYDGKSDLSGTYEFSITNGSFTTSKPFTIHKQFKLGNTSGLPEQVYRDLDTQLEVPITDVTIDEFLVKVTDSNNNPVASFSEFDIEDVNTEEKKLYLSVPDTIPHGTYQLFVSDKHNILTRTFEFEVLESIFELSHENLSLEIGDTFSMQVTVVPDDDPDILLRWYSSDRDVVTVDQETGFITAEGRGTATITVTSNGGSKIDTCEVKVIQPDITNVQLAIDSNYDNKLYYGYGGRVRIDVTTQDIEDNDVLSVSYYKDGVFQTEKTMAVLNNKADLEIDVVPEMEVGIYKVEIRHRDTTKSVEFEVYPPKLVSEILADDITLINDGISKDIEYTINPGSAFNKEVEFIIEDETIAVIEEGKIKGLKEGNTTLTIRAKDGSNVEKTVNVTVMAQMIELTEVTKTPDPLYDYIGGKVSLSATLKNISSNKVTVDVYKEGSESIITREFNVENNVVNIELDIPSSITKGTYTIKVSSGDINATKTFEVAEYIHVESVTLNKERLELLKDSKETLIVTINPDNALNKNVTWTSSNPSVATVDENGLVTAAGRGTATITVTSEDGSKTDTCEVTVDEPDITDVQLTIDSNYDNKLYKGYGGTVRIDITTQDVKDNEKLTVNYYKGEVLQSLKTEELTVSTNKANLTIDVRPEMEVGIYKVEISYGNIEKTVEFEVYQPILVSEIKANDETLKIGENKQLEIEILPSNAFNKKVMYETSDDSVVSVDENGKITAHKKGTATITITSQDGSNVVKNILVVVTGPELVLKETSSYKITEEDNKKYIENIVLAQELGGIKTLTREEFVAHFENFDGEIYEKDGTTKVENATDIMKTGMIIRNSSGEYHIIIKGDVNGDGAVASGDVLLMRRHIVEIKKLDDIYVKAGEIDDGGLTSGDALKLRRYIVGMGEI